MTKHLPGGKKKWLSHFIALFLLHIVLLSPVPRAAAHTNLLRAHAIFNQPELYPSWCQFEHLLVNTHLLRYDPPCVMIRPCSKIWSCKTSLILLNSCNFLGQKSPHNQTFAGCSPFLIAARTLAIYMRYRSVLLNEIICSAKGNRWDCLNTLQLQNIRKPRLAHLGQFSYRSSPKRLLQSEQAF